MMPVFPTETLGARPAKRHALSAPRPVRVALASPFTIPVTAAITPSATLWKLRLTATSLAHRFVCITYITNKSICQEFFEIFLYFLSNTGNFAYQRRNQRQ